MKYNLIKDGNVLFARPVNDYDSNFPKGWGVYKEGWYTESQVLELGLSIEGRNTRVVEDSPLFPAYEEVRESETILYAEIPAISHTEYWVDKNYTIEAIDETATSEYKDQQRKDEYNKLGVTTEAIAVALWEKIVENRPESANALQVLRTEVKQKFPKN